MTNSRPHCPRTFRIFRSMCLLAAVAISVWPSAMTQAAETVATYQAVLDNTMIKPEADSTEPLHSNGAGNFFSAGLTKLGTSGKTHRGLLQFDLSEIPSGAIIKQAALKLYVVEVAKRGYQYDRSFWLARVPDLGAVGWGEGTSNADIFTKGQGDGLDATAGDATWLDKQYPSVPWPTGMEGVLGDDPATFDPADAAGIVPGYTDPASTPVLLDWQHDDPAHAMLADIQAWVDGASNFGWVLVGEEAFVNPDGEDNSSKRSFASREYVDDAGSSTFYGPVLTVTYEVVPEPATIGLLLSGLLAAAGVIVLRRRRLQSSCD